MSRFELPAGIPRRRLAWRVVFPGGSWYLLLMCTWVCGGEANILAITGPEPHGSRPASSGYGFAAAGALWSESQACSAVVAGFDEPVEGSFPMAPAPDVTGHPRAPPLPYGQPLSAANPAYTSPQYGPALLSNVPANHVGLGSPLVGASWNNRPYYVGWMFGTVRGDSLVDGQIDQDGDMLGGYRLGWDFDPFWGIEGRYAFSYLELEDLRTGTNPGTTLDEYWDVSLQYYPWGDAAWRPFASLGVGLAQFRFNDGLGTHYDESLFELPLGMGVKYFFRNWLALRFTAMDNLAFSGGGLDTMHNLSFTGDVEVHFGGSRTSYFPWNPSISLW